MFGPEAILKDSYLSNIRFLVQIYDKNNEKPCDGSILQQFRWSSLLA